MKGFSVAVLLFLLPMLSPSCVAADDGWYTSLDLGLPHYSGLMDADGPYGSVPNSRLRDSSLDIRAAAGYRFNPYIGLEAGYIYFGTVEQTYTECIFSCYVASQDLDTDGYALEMTGSLPLGNSWSLFGRAGELITSTHINGQRSDGSILTYGLGAAWAFSPHFSARLSWDDYHNINAHFLVFRNGKYSVNVLSLGLVYSFR